MTDDFYCDEVLSGKTPVDRVAETGSVLAFYHTRPSYPVHIVVIPKKHIPSFLEVTDADNSLLLEMMHIIQRIAGKVQAEHGACRIVTNLGNYQESKHLHWHVISGDRIR